MLRRSAPSGQPHGALFVVVSGFSRTVSVLAGLEIPSPHDSERSHYQQNESSYGAES